MRVGAEASADDTPQCLPDLSVESFGVGTALSRSLPPDASPYSQLGRLGVTLMLVSDSKHVVLIHGSWRRGACPGSIRRPGLHSAHPNAALSRAAFARGRREDRVTEHPGLHRRPSGSRRRPEFPTPSCRAFPGGLLAQLVAARSSHAGLIAACPPAIGPSGLNPTTARISLPHALRPRPWSKPVYPPPREQFRH
jgi:hypothetical protein